MERKKQQPKNAKFFNNVILRPILDIELEQVVPPYLHILLGVVKKHHDHLEKDCQSLDDQLAQSLANGSAYSGNTTSVPFQNHVQQLEEIGKKRKQAHSLHRRLRSMTQDERQEAGKRLEELRKDTEGSKKNMTSLPLLAGPVTANLDTVLKAESTLKHIIVDLS